MAFAVVETFLSLGVASMERAATFYAGSLGAVATWTSPRWSSLKLAGVRIGLFEDPAHGGGRTGLHVVVTDLGAACAAVERAGGTIVFPAHQVAPGVLVAEVSDTEGNVFSLQESGS